MEIKQKPSKLDGVALALALGFFVAAVIYGVPFLMELIYN